ncbi:isoprenylcysteine carboxylmethyltransferase family protein [Microbacterium horticulturae]|uniref:Isoprenylcysteine carboxylmethyltransferase family protein n=1 Tax=Microbacterium horticulturae TaxID=3028316 RepID=A0ABY8BTR5_9MICO|nr:isoprenylcysteine carboxylmethyltransferase family protein [Microbacterium sp. KACC 23027]WEG07551.1 isoprenylcysteine carboxylmethyltransferase family protein [Microbacterium sp. KACC 23027]
MSVDDEKVVPPPIVLIGAAGVQTLLTRKRESTAGSRVAAATVAAGSGALAVWAVAALRRHGTTLTPEHPERTTRLVTDGPFAYSRNPVYLALTGLLVAHAVLKRSFAALVPAAGFLAVVDRTQVPREERALRSRFGRRFVKYRRSVPRWLGEPEA